MVIRLKVLRKQEERINKIKDMMDMFKVPTMPKYEYQPVGGSAVNSNSNLLSVDPKIAKTKELFQMFHLAR